MRKGWLNNETIHSLASSRKHIGTHTIDNVDNYVKEWWRVSPEEETTINRSTMKLMDKLYKALKQRDQYKAERDTLIDDLSWYKAKVSRLEQRHSKLIDENTRLQNELYTMGLNQDEADDKIKEYKTLLSEISQHIGNKPSSSTYKYFRAKLNALEIREGD